MSLIFFPIIKRCLLLGGSLTKIVAFGTKHFVRYSRHVRYLGCPLLGGFTVYGVKIIVRSSCPEVLCKKGAFRNFAKFILKKELWHNCFSENFGKFLRTPFLTENLPWLLLHCTEEAIRRYSIKKLLRKISENS